MIKYAFIILSFFSIQFSLAQGFSFRSVNALPITSNPAFAGTGATARLNYAVGLTNIGFTSYSLQNYASYDQAVDVLHGGIGIEVKHANILHWQNYKSAVKLNYSFQQSLSEKLSLSIGARASFSRQVINLNAYSYYNYPDDSLEIINNFHYSLGGLVYSDKFFIGLVYLPYTYENASGEVELSSGFSSTIGYNWTPFKNKELSFTPVVNYGYRDGFQMLNVQLSYNTKRFSIGGSCAPRAFTTFFAGYQFDRFRIKAVFGSNLSPLTNATSSSQELIFQYNFGKLKNNVSKDFKMNLF